MWFTELAQQTHKSLSFLVSLCFHVTRPSAKMSAINKENKGQIYGYTMHFRLIAFFCLGYKKGYVLNTYPYWLYNWA